MLKLKFSRGILILFANIACVLILLSTVTDAFSSGTPAASNTRQTSTATAQSAPQTFTGITASPPLFSTDSASQFPGSGYSVTTTSGVVPGVTSLSGMPKTAPPAQGVTTQSYLYNIPTTATTASVTAPTCPVGYKQQIYITPVSYVGANYVGHDTGISPLYGVYAYATAVASSSTVVGATIASWTVGLSALNMSGSWVAQPGYFIATTQCCNPNAPGSQNCEK